MDLFLIGNVIYAIVMYAFDVKSLVALAVAYLLMLVVVAVVAMIIIFATESGGTADI